MKRTILTLMLALHGGNVFSGGSGERVWIESLSVRGDDYELVVVPQNASSQNKDPFMGECPRFIVKGIYSQVHAWRFPTSVSRKNHLNALAFLEHAHASNTSVILGWVGTGFVPLNAANKCVVRSRALELVDEHGERAIVSYHDPI